MSLRGSDKHWKWSAGPYDDRELDIWLEEDRVEYRQWWDAGHNPNVDRLTLAQLIDKLENAMVWAVDWNIPNKVREEILRLGKSLS